jgi:hypothetical protein
MNKLSHTNTIEVKESGIQQRKKSSSSLSNSDDCRPRLIIKAAVDIKSELSSAADLLGKTREKHKTDSMTGG